MYGQLVNASGKTVDLPRLSSPIRLGARDIGGAPFYIGRSQFGYWKHTQFVIDIVPGRGGMFSLENGRGVRFRTRSRLFTDDECLPLAPIFPRDASDRDRVFSDPT
jgi:Protein of unknown function (DUF779)